MRFSATSFQKVNAMFDEVLQYVSAPDAALTAAERQARADLVGKKGISGNPGGSPKQKAFTEALRNVAGQVDSKSKKTKLMRLAEKLFDHAIVEGEAWAFQQIADRLDGRPIQSTTAVISSSSAMPS
jgi:hypothetical protein